MQVSVGRRHDSYIDGNILRSPDAGDDLLLQDPQQFGLPVGAHVADFIQKQCAAIRRFKLPVPRFAGIGKRPPFVSEQFALQQRIGHRRAVDGDEGLFAA